MDLHLSKGAFSYEYLPNASPQGDTTMKEFMELMFLLRTLGRQFTRLKKTVAMY